MRKTLFLFLLLGNVFALSGQQTTTELDQSMEEMIKAAEEAAAETDDSYEDYDEYDEVEYGEVVAPDIEYDRSLRTVSEKRWQEIKEDERFQYKKLEPVELDSPSYKEPQGNFNWFNSGFFEFLLYLAVAGFIIFILYNFLKNNDFSLNKKKKVSLDESDTPWEDVEHFDEWDRALQQALHSKNYRLAVRILYLKNLQGLNKGGHIQYREEYTNWHYVYKLSGSNYFEPWRKLSTYFDYIWYGEYAIDQAQYQQLANDFNQFEQQL